MLQTASRYSVQLTFKLCLQLQLPPKVSCKLAADKALPNTYILLPQSAFALESIPAQEWYLTSRGSCNSVAPVRSMLTYHWRQQNSHAVNNDWKYNHHGEETGLNKFTRFGPQSPTAAAVLAGVPPTLTGDARLVNPRYALSYHSEEHRRSGNREECAGFVRQGLNNLLGTLPLASQTEPVGSVIVEILGSESKPGKLAAAPAPSDIVKADRSCLSLSLASS